MKATKLNEKEIESMNQLIEYNNDRTNGYQKAATETDHADLKQLFNKYSAQSTQFGSQLHQRVLSLGGEPATGTTNSGKIYRAWMDVKAALTGKDRKAVLNSCEFGEDVALHSYGDALKTPELSVESRSLIEQQSHHIREAHNEIKNLRDQAE